MPHNLSADVYERPARDLSLPYSCWRDELVKEVALVREVHGHARGFCSFDHLLVPGGAAGLDDCTNAGVDQDLRAIREREERVGCGDAAASASSGPLHGEFARVDAVDLTHPDAHGRALVGEQDCVGLDCATG